MLPKYFPVILVAKDSSGLHFKTVHNPEEHAAFCTRYVRPETVLETIKTIGALHQEVMSEEYMMDTFRRIADGFMEGLNRGIGSKKIQK